MSYQLRTSYFEPYLEHDATGEELLEGETIAVFSSLDQAVTEARRLRDRLEVEEDTGSVIEVVDTDLETIVWRDMVGAET